LLQRCHGRIGVGLRLRSLDSSRQDNLDQKNESDDRYVLSHAIPDECNRLAKDIQVNRRLLRDE
ncbi:MAG: hypothetical protein WA476_05000, partial [Acidobacteriaceae bacterium]